MEPEKRNAEDEGQAFLSDDETDGGARPVIEGPGKKRRLIFGGLRLAVEIAMLGFIVFLLAAKPYCGYTIRNLPVPRLPRKIYTFHDNPRYLKEEMWFNETVTLKTLHNWIELSASKSPVARLPRVLTDGSYRRGARLRRHPERREIRPPEPVHGRRQPRRGRPGLHDERLSPAALPVLPRRALPAGLRGRQPNRRGGAPLIALLQLPAAGHHVRRRHDARGRDGGRSRRGLGARVRRL
jgi:hypothetical protein